MHLRRFLSASVAALAVLGAAACGGSDGPTDTTEGADLVIYSGRSESLVAGVLEDLEQQTGVKVGVRYAGSSELAAPSVVTGSAAVTTDWATSAIFLFSFIAVLRSRA